MAEAKIPDEDIATKSVGTGRYSGVYRNVHPSFSTPLGSTKIWRYMDTAKFMDLIQSKSLWFSRSDLLGDPFEGSITSPDYEAEKLQSSETAEELKTKSNRKQIVDSMYINCWHMNEYESAAMWSIYAPNRDAVAVVTDYKTLSECLPAWIYIGMVKYIDYSRDTTVFGNVFNPFLHKRASFSHETELRAVLWDSSAFSSNKAAKITRVEPAAQEIEKCLKDSGAAVPINLASLIHSIYVSPTSPKWYRELISDFCNKNGLKVDVSQSSLLENALF
ncbi:hypothetical protein [Methylorubrum sp. SB2]|uniref:hypothetical protein n=1 Tax=Methylorubrum subtropicum TaxID=3138812 RepID=UPI00313AF749